MARVVFALKWANNRNLAVPPLPQGQKCQNKIWIMACCHSSCINRRWPISRMKCSILIWMIKVLAAMNSLMTKTLTDPIAIAFKVNTLLAILAPQQKASGRPKTIFRHFLRTAGCPKLTRKVRRLFVHHNIIRVITSTICHSFRRKIRWNPSCSTKA